MKNYLIISIDCLHELLEKIILLEGNLLCIKDLGYGEVIVCYEGKRDNFYSYLEEKEKGRYVDDCGDYYTSEVRACRDKSIENYIYVRDHYYGGNYIRYVVEKYYYEKGLIVNGYKSAKIKIIK